MTRRRDNGAGNVRQDPNRPGSWIGTVTIDGRRYSARGRNKTDVSAKLAQIRAEVLTGTGKSTADRKLTVEQVIDQFLARELPSRMTHGRPLAPGTIANYHGYMTAVRDEIGKLKLADLTVQRVETMYDDLVRERGWSHATLNKARSMLSTIVTWAEKRGVVPRNVVRLTSLTPTAARAKKRRALAPDEARQLLDALRHERNGAMYGVSLLLGLRPGEAAALHWDDVDVEQRTVNVTRGAQRDARGGVQVVDDLKTSSAKRTIEMTPDLAAWFADHRRAQRVERIAARTWGDDQLVFTTPRGTVTDASNNRDELAAICARAGVTVILPNELRHTSASLLSDMGVPNEHIADLLGHTTTRMVEQTYRHRLRPVVDVAARADWSTVRN